MSELVKKRSETVKKKRKDGKLQNSKSAPRSLTVLTTGEGAPLKPHIPLSQRTSSKSTSPGPGHYQDAFTYSAFKMERAIRSRSPSRNEKPSSRFNNDEDLFSTPGPGAYAVSNLRDHENYQSTMHRSVSTFFGSTDRLTAKALDRRDKARRLNSSPGPGQYELSSATTGKGRSAVFGHFAEGKPGLPGAAGLLEARRHRSPGPATYGSVHTFGKGGQLLGDGKPGASVGAVFGTSSRFGNAKPQSLCSMIKASAGKEPGPGHYRDSHSAYLNLSTRPASTCHSFAKLRRVPDEKAKMRQYEREVPGPGSYPVNQGMGVVGTARIGDKKPLCFKFGTEPRGGVPEQVLLREHRNESFYRNIQH